MKKMVLTTLALLMAAGALSLWQMSRQTRSPEVTKAPVDPTVLWDQHPLLAISASEHQNLGTTEQIISQRAQTICRARHFQAAKSYETQDLTEQIEAADLGFSPSIEIELEYLKKMGENPQPNFVAFNKIEVLANPDQEDSPVINTLYNQVFTKLECI